MRLREDELFVQRMTQNLQRTHKTHFKMVDLNLKDAPIRLRCPLDRICDTPVNPEDPSIEKIRKALGRQAEAGNLEALALPLALGNNVDHLTVRDAALPLSTSLPSAFYEDLPYAATHAAGAAALESLSDTFSSYHQPLSPVLCGMDNAVEFKRHLALGYASQIEEEEANVISGFAQRYNGAERLWANRAWQNIAEPNRLSISQP